MIKPVALMIAPLALLAASTVAVAKETPSAHLYGPQPSWEQFRAIGEAGIRERMLDPDSARISWVSGFFKGEYKPLLEARVYGYVACGTVNARNRLGGYAGTASFVVVIDYDRVLLADIDKERFRPAFAYCTKELAAGRMPPVPGGVTQSVSAPLSSGLSSGSSSPSGSTSPSNAVTTNAAPTTLVSAGSGMTLMAMPDGAYIRAVVPGSLAAAAGLKPGMVVASVNAIPLAGMGDAMLKVIDAAGTGASLAIVGGMTVRLGEKR